MGRQWMDEGKLAMPSGWTLYQYEGRWFEKEFDEAELSDNRLVVDIEADEGDTVTVTAVSKDGATYKGDYRYREGSASNGEVWFERYRGPAGDVFVGEWREAGGPTGRWMMLIRHN